MGRCECGRKLVLSSVQPHGKAAAIPLLVCPSTMLPPEDCEARAIVRVVRRAGEEEIWNVVVDDTLLGNVATTYPGTKLLGYIWVVRSGPAGVSSSRDDGVRNILRKAMV